MTRLLQDEVPFFDFYTHKHGLPLLDDSCNNTTGNKPVLRLVVEIHTKQRKFQPIKKQQICSTCKRRSSRRIN
jgi:hypothetical protein